jgi:H+-transporting ATPase
MRFVAGAAVRQGRIAFRRLLTYAFNMLTKKFEIVLFLAIGLALTGQAVMTPVLMVLPLVINDFLSMSLTSDRASAAAFPSVWRMRNITAAALLLGLGKLAHRGAGVRALRSHRRGVALAFVALVFGNQAQLYVLRDRGRLWASRPSPWVLASSTVDIAMVTALALSGTLMAPLPARLLAALFAAAVAFALLLDQVKRPVTRLFKAE